MAPEPVSPPDFGQAQAIAFGLGGTIAIPSPFPASGRLWIGLFPKPAGAKGDYEHKFFLKMVQSVSEKLIITVFISLDDFRAVRLHKGEKSLDDLHSWSLKTAADVGVDIENQGIKKSLMSKSVSNGPFEIELYAQEAILYVPESAPLLVRIELGWTADKFVKVEEFVKNELIPAEMCCPYH